jgi:signal transduction histidine kinase
LIAMRAVPLRWQRLPRRTIRLRLTLLYGGLFLGSGAGLLTITYVLVRNRLPVMTSSDEISGAVGTQAGHSACFVTSPAGSPPITTAPPPDCLAYAQSLLNGERSAVLSQLLTDTGIALAIMTVVSIALGWLMAGRVLRPLRTITAAARYISASSLHERLALTGPDDELKELGDTFDGLLARLEASFRAQRQFVANASHELRTPLARQRTVVEVALADPDPSIASLQAACQRVLVAGEQQERLIEALLTLARSERGLDRQEPLDLSAIAREVLASRRDDARSRDVSLEADLGSAHVLGDPRLAERLLANLIDNAIRHNRPGGRARVSTATSTGHAILSVTNTGPAVPPDQIDRLFQPFQRLRAGRTAMRDGDGLGLGLPIVVAIAAAHGAYVRARSRPSGGLSVAVRFPHVPGQPSGNGHPGGQERAHPVRIRQDLVPRAAGF